MARLIVSEFVSLDGVMEAPGGEPGHPHSGWVMGHVAPEWQRFKLDEALEAETLLLGRVTYEGFAAAWPEREGEFADKMNRMPKLVASTTLRDPAWQSTSVIQGDVIAAVDALRRAAAGPILVAGSRTLVHALIGAGHVDEYRLMVFPVVLGGGRRLWPEAPDKRELRLAGVRSFPPGVVLQTYTPA